MYSKEVENWLKKKLEIIGIEFKDKDIEEFLTNLICKSKNLKKEISDVHSFLDMYKITKTSEKSNFSLKERFMFLAKKFENQISKLKEEKNNLKDEIKILKYKLKEAKKKGKEK